VTLEGRRPLRIGYLVQQFIPEIGAGPARAAEMTKRWAAAGAEVTVITAMPNRPQGRIHPQYQGRLFSSETWEGVRVLRSWLFARPGGGLGLTLVNNTSFAVTAGINALRRAGPLDVLIASSPPYFPLLAGAVLRALWDTPLVLELRDLWPEYLIDMGVIRARLLQEALLAADRALLRRADHVVVVTEPFRTRVIAKGIPPERCTVITNGVDPVQYSPGSAPPPIPQLTGAPGGFVVGYLGNFGAGQGLGVVLDAARRLAALGSNISFVLAGDGTELAQVRANAAALALPNLTITAAIPKAETRAFYLNCDCCLVPLAPIPVFADVLPSKCFEIMACGRPVIASAAGEVASLLERSGGGWAVPPGDGAALAEALGRLSRLPVTERAAMGARGTTYVSQHFHRDILAQRYLAVLESAAGFPR